MELDRQAVDLRVSKKITYTPTMLALGRQRLEDPRKFKASIDYMVSFRLARAK